MYIENQIVEIKGQGHPDQLADTLSDVAVSAIHDHNEELYANLDNCYLKAGRFPEFIVGGQMSFDFDVYSKQDRYDLENYVKSQIIDEFKKLFSYAKIDVDFQIALYPNPKENLAFNKKHDESTYVTAFYPFSDIEVYAKAIDEYLSEDVKYCGSDYSISIYPDSIIVNACFFENDGSLKSKLEEELKSEFDAIPNIDSLIVNPESSFTGVKFNRFGSTLFNNESGVTGRGNDLYGFKSPHRPNNVRNLKGKDSRSSNRLLFSEAYKIAKQHYEENEEPMAVTAYCKAGDDNDDIGFIENKLYKNEIK